MTITGELPLETGELMEKALDRARDSTASQAPERVDESWSAQQADALIVIANVYLSGNGEASASTSDNYQVTVHVDCSALANGDGRSSLPIESVKRLCCDGDTSLDNLMLLCSLHHRLVHEGGFSIERDYQNHWFFKRLDGMAVPVCGYQVRDMIDDDIGDKTGELSSVINNPSAEGFFPKVKSSLAAPPI